MLRLDEECDADVNQDWESAMNLSETVVHISFREEDFRIRFFEPFQLIFCCALSVSELFFFLSGPNPPVVYFLICPITVALLCALAVGLMTWAFRFEVGPEGIDCHDLWRRPQHVSWRSIERLRYLNLMGADYLLIENSGARPIWLPLFVGRRDVLHRMLLTYASSTPGIERYLTASE